mgnify:CR=1 FL=1
MRTPESRTPLVAPELAFNVDVVCERKSSTLQGGFSTIFRIDDSPASVFASSLYDSSMSSPRFPCIERMRMVCSFLQFNPLPGAGGVYITRLDPQMPPHIAQRAPERTTKNFEPWQAPLAPPRALMALKKGTGRVALYPTSSSVGFKRKDISLPRI